MVGALVKQCVMDLGSRAYGDWRVQVRGGFGVEDCFLEFVTGLVGDSGGVKCFIRVSRLN